MYTRRQPNSLPPTSAAQNAAINALLAQHPQHHGLRIGKDGPFLGVYFYPDQATVCAAMFRITKDGHTTQI